MDDYSELMPKPLPKEPTPEPIKVEPRESEEQNEPEEPTEPEPVEKPESDSALESTKPESSLHTLESAQTIPPAPFPGEPMPIKVESKIEEKADSAPVPELKPLPKEPTPEPIKVEPRAPEESTEPEEQNEPEEPTEPELAKEPAPAAPTPEAPAKEPTPEAPAKEAPTPETTTDEVFAEAVTKAQEAPAYTTTFKTASGDQKPDPNALAEALIMTHQSKTRKASKNKKSVFVFIALIIGLAIAFGVLVASGIIRLDFSQFFGGNGGSGGNGGGGSSTSQGPTAELAKSVCDAYGFDFHYDEDTANFFGGDELDGMVFKKYICEPQQKSTKSGAINPVAEAYAMDDEDEEDEESETKTIKVKEGADFYFRYMILNQDYDTIKGLKTHFDELKNYYNVNEDSDGKFFKAFHYRSDEYTYIVAYKQGIIEIASDDYDVIEDILVDIGFPDRYRVDV